MSSVGKRRFTDDDDDDDEDMELRRGPWTLEEDTLLIHYIACHGEGRWDMLAKCSGLKRTGKSCRLRWLNYLKPDVKRGNLTLEEQVLILELHSKWGNRWSRIAQHLPGRTDNEIKNYWRTRVQKQARQLKIDANSSRFRDAIRCVWMPRMLQKIEESSSSSSSTMNPQVSPTPRQASSLSVLPPPLPIQGCYSHQEYNSTNSEKCTSPSMSANELLLCRQQQLCHEGVRLESMSAMPGLENSISDCHMEDNDWANIEVADNLWNMDELWQFSMS